MRAIRLFLDECADAGERVVGKVDEVFLHLVRSRGQGLELDSGDVHAFDFSVPRDGVAGVVVSILAPSRLPQIAWALLRTRLCCQRQRETGRQSTAKWADVLPSREPQWAIWVVYDCGLGASQSRGSKR